MRKIILLFFIFLSFFLNAHEPNYGLYFKSHKYMGAERTALVLNNNKPFRLNKEFILSVKHTAVSSLPLGSDPLGNIARINNLLESYPKKLADAEQKLETVKEQLENAKQEVVKPFPKEKELNQMMERLSELNALLNMDEQGSSEEPENSGKQSIHDKLNAIKQKGQQEHDHDKTAKGNDIDCS